ncbi:MAG: lamin tail domain-containing protein [Lentimicrobium sp.]
MKARNILLLLIIIGLNFTSCVKDEVFEGPPVLSELSITPQAPGESDIVTVSVKATDMNGIKSVKLHYAVDGVSATGVSMSAGSTANVYTAQIPAQGAGKTVTYYVEAENESGKIAYTPEGAPATPAAYTVGAPSIVLNEVYSRGTVEAPDWVEIYNNSDSPADISGYRVYDPGGQSGSKPKKEIPAGTILPGKGFYVIVVDDGTESGFGLSSGGDEVWLENTSGNIIDNVAHPAFEPSQSYGRIPDGTGAWQILDKITRGAVNDDSPPAPVILINEVYSRGTTENPDWIEIYNATTASVDISGYKVYDNGGQAGTKPKKEIPAGTTIPSKGFYVIIVDDEDASGFGLSSGGEQVWLENTSGTVIDDVTFPALEETQSYGRYPDGDANWQVLYVATPGSANDNSPAPSAVVLMNEIYSRGTTEDPDWIEIYNTSTSVAADISGFKIYDSGGQAGTKPKKEIPAGTIIQPGGFFVIVVDDEDASGFGLSSGGEQVWLENTSGTVVDDITFPALAETESYGRYPDGSSNLQILSVITKGAANDNSTPPPATIILMNEIYSRGTTEDPDWIEIYNGSAFDVDLSGYKIYDGGGQAGTKPKKEFPAGTIIPAGGFYVIVTDDADASGFGLSSGGEQVWLENAEGTVIDDVTFPAFEPTQSFGRKPDGSSNLVIFTEITRGSSNNNAGTLPKARRK